MAGHTPGPWQILPSKDRYDLFYQIGHSGGGFPRVIGTVNRQAITMAEENANAQLIAAAPDLLEALLAHEDRAQRGILNMTSAEIDNIDKLRRAAIAKAAGQS